MKNQIKNLKIEQYCKTLDNQVKFDKENNDKSHNKNYLEIIDTWEKCVKIEVKYNELI